MTDDRTSDADYDRGFADGLRWVASVLRHSALVVERPQYGEFKTGNGNHIKAIRSTGQSHFASQLREVAQTIENAINQEPAK